MSDTEQDVNDKQQTQTQQEETDELDNSNNVNNNAAEQITEDQEQKEIAEGHEDNDEAAEEPVTGEQVEEETDQNEQEQAGDGDGDKEAEETREEGEVENDENDKLEEQNEDTTQAVENTEEKKESEEAEEKPAETTGEAVEETPPDKDNVGTGTEAPEGSPPEPEVDPHAATPEPKIDKDATATVRFVLLPSGQVATLRCSLTQTLQELKDHFAAELKMPSSVILLMLDGKNMDNKLTLLELGVGPNGTIQLEMQSADPVNTPIKAIRPRQEYHMPDVITVRVASGDGSESDIVVEIERTTRKKPFLGGYRHKQSGVEYHHASAQTMQKARPVSSVPRFCRDTQTVEQKHRVQQTKNDMSTQMTKIGVYMSNMEDKLVVPGKYTTADEYHQSVFNKIVVLQKYYRRWLAKRYVEKVRHDKEARLEWERQEEIRKRKKKKVPTATLR